MMTVRRRWGSFLSAVTCFCLLHAISPQRLSAAPQKPNVIFIFSDDHAYQAVGAYGSKINKTPNIDRLAREGMLFRHCFVTNSICGPSRATILTGKYSHKHGFYRNGDVFNGAQQTFPKLLQNAGWQTALFGKWHLAGDPAGFDRWEILNDQGEYYNPNFKTPQGMKTSSGYVTDLITHKAIDWLQNGRDESRPFMLMLQHKAPHRPWEPGPSHLTMYDAADIPEPETLFDDYSHRASPASEQTMTIAKHMLLGSDLKVWPKNPTTNGIFKSTYGRLTPEQRQRWDAAYQPKNEAFLKANPQGKDLVRWKYQRYIKDYLSCIASVDDNVGKLLDYLDANKSLADNTVVIYCSDQGFYLGEHGWYDKRWMYEESLRTPFLVRWPGTIKPGSENKDFVSNLDFAETFLEIAGVPIPPDMQGKSLAPIFQGNTPADWRKNFYYHYYENDVHTVPGHLGVRTERYKLIRYYETDEWELFDLKTDPRELHSVYGKAGMEKITDDLKLQIAALQKQYDDTNPERLLPPRTPVDSPRPKTKTKK